MKHASPSLSSKFPAMMRLAAQPRFLDRPQLQTRV
jgi:hypothetical protein